ncbi:tetratricopeptide repeat protein [Fibrella forsythiae]|uniref:Tetratricopeptide repeat protein n=1 Tax=Fibrella forsythiae TaxID=2817061 RepID=A0ABS3JJL3_9BACT|nr:tetratricopeptide repeat protein [Fibrella forsythiae]MBO0949633.1 tetratricopeptide repeat protein [Fibrella forsythiae]
MDLSNDLFNEIDAYLNKRMSPTERQVFMERMNQDAELRQEVDIQQQIQDGLDAVVMQRQLAAMRTGIGRQQRLRRTVRYASAFVLLCLAFTGGFFWYQSTQTLTPEQAFMAYYEPEPNAREDAVQPAGLAAARAEYYAEHYPEALRLLTSIPPDSLGLVSYYRGITLLAMSRPNDAIPALSSVSQSPDLSLRQRADWYIALAYLKTGDTTKARQTLQVISDNNTHPYREWATDVLEKLR